MARFKCSFKDDWLLNPKFETWLREVPENKTKAYCMLCKFTFSLSNMGRRAVASHWTGKKHQLKEKGAVTSSSLSNFFSGSRNSSHDAPPKDTSTVVNFNDKVLQINVESTTHPSSVTKTTDCDNTHLTCSSSDQQFSGRMSKFLIKENVTRAEIIWCLQAVLTHKSLRSAEKDVKMFKTMFPDSEIARDMQLGRDKMAYTIVYGLSPFFKEQLINILLPLKHFVLDFDESMNKVSQKQQMDISIKFWDEETNQVNTRYFSSTFLGHTRSSDLLSAFKEATHPLDLKKLLQISMDGPNVNFKFFKELQYFIKNEDCDPEILTVGSCGLHAVNVAFKTGATATGWKLIEFHRALYYIFKDTPARRSLYTFYTKSDVFPLKFCSVRWLENSCVAERSLEMLPHLKKFIEGVQKDKVAPKSKSYLVVKNAVNDQLFPAKLSFFRLVASGMESFLREYQSDIPLIPFLYNDLSTMIGHLMERFIEKDVVNKTNIMDINVNDKTKFLPLKKIEVGISTQSWIKKAKAPETDVVVFYKECREFLIKCVEKLKERSPISYELTKAVSCFDPKISLNYKIFCIRLKKLLLILTKKYWLNDMAADRALCQLKEICSLTEIIQHLKTYRRSERVDKFWFNILSSEENAEDSINILKMVMILSHGNANVERGFSINNVLDNVEISKKMLQYARNARSKFSEAAAKKRNEDKEKTTALQRKREASMQLKELEAKRLKILQDAQKESSAIEEEIAALHLKK